MKRRRARGTFIVITSILAFFLLLPVTIFFFEVARVNLAHRQLRNVTDSAALAAALFVRANSGLNDAELQDKTNAWALNYVKRNLVINAPLSAAKIGLPATDKTSMHDCIVRTVIDKTKKEVRAEAAFGLPPSFGGLLGLRTFQISAVSKATYAADGPIDVVIVVDHSTSMRNHVPMSGSSSTDEGDPEANPYLPEGPEQPGTMKAINAASEGLVTMINKIRSEGDVHFGFVRYSAKAQNVVALDTSAERAEEALAQAADLKLSDGTNTAEAVRSATNMLNGSGHRPGASKVIILLTDGLPHMNGANQPDMKSQNLALFAGTVANQSDITVYTLGFFHGTKMRDIGIEFVRKFDDACGKKGAAFTFPDVQGLRDAIQKLTIHGNADISLVN